MTGRMTGARHTAGILLHGLSNQLRTTSQRLFPALSLLDSKGYSEISQAELGSASLLVNGEENILSGQLSNIYDRHLFTATCVNYIAERMASVPLRFYTETVRDGRTEREPADDDPVAEVFSWWNPHMNSYECKEMLAAWWLLTGVSYAAKLKSDNPKYEFELWPLFTPGVQVLRGTRGLLGYRYRMEGHEINLLPEEVLAVRSFSTTDRFGGAGKLYSGRHEVVTDLRARQWNDELLKRGVHVSGVLEAEESMNPDKARRIRDSFMKDYAGSSKAMRLMVLYGGLKFRPTTFAHKDIFWAEQLKMTKEDISLAFGIPEEILGAKSANHASLREKRRIFWEDTVKSIGRRFEAAINDTFLPSVGSELQCEFDYTNVEALQADRVELMKAGEIGVRNGLYTINEYRTEVLRLDPIDGGDEPMIGRGLAPLSSIMDGETEGQTSASLSAKTILKAEAEFIETIEKVRARTETRIQGVIRRASREMEGSILEALGPIPSDAVLADVEDIIAVQGNEALRAQTVAELQAAMEASGAATNGAIGVQGGLRLRNTAAERVLKQQDGNILRVGTRQAQQLRRSLAEGLQLGESEDALKQRVRGFFRGERANALTIARTETTRAINSASKESLVQARERYGIETQMEWSMSRDDLVRGRDPNDRFDHWSMHGEPIDPNTEMFNVSGEMLEYPGDSDGGSPGNTINCRCGIIPKVVVDPRRRGARARMLRRASEYFDEKMADALEEYTLSGTPAPNGEELVGILNAEGNGNGSEES